MDNRLGELEEKLVCAEKKYVQSSRNIKRYVMLGLLDAGVAFLFGEAYDQPLFTYAGCGLLGLTGVIAASHEGLKQVRDFLREEVRTAYTRRNSQPSPPE